jgi:uncharacterized protein involved in outer membrane biogenesis
MVKKIVIGALVLVIVASIGLFFWARAVFTHDTVRTALANQLSESLGQPVTVGTIGAGLYPRVTVNLGQVTIGQPARIQVQTLHVGTDFRALLSRRIEHATLRLSGARIELPLPEFSVGSSTEPNSPDASGASPVEIVSIDEIVLRDVEIKSGARILRGDIELVPRGNGVTLKKVTLQADDTTIDLTGEIKDVAGPVGELTVKAGALNFDRLLAFVSDFAGNAGLATATTKSAPKSKAATAKGPAMNVMLSLQADRASMGTLALEKLSGRAQVTSDAMTLQPVTFGVFDGTYDGSLRFSLGSSPDFRLNATVSGVDMAAATKFAGSPDTITGRLSGKLSLSGRGVDAASALNSARGTARVDITKGTVKNLGLVRTVVTSTSGRSGAPAKSASSGSRDESFERLGATLALANGSASTQDLRFESPDVLLAATGGLRLDGSAINLAGQVQLSDELSQQAGRDLVRYTQEQGRVTLPATITGTADNPQVRIDVAKLATRALTNKATEEAEKVLKKNLDSLFKR